MSNLLERGLRMAAREIPRAAGPSDEILIYRRGSATVELHGVIPREPQYDVTDATEFAGGISHLDKDWMVPVDALVFAGRHSEPQRGDEIRTTAGEVYEVAPYGKSECFRPVGTPPTWFRIHTKKTK